jgi:hypothetical protein
MTTQTATITYFGQILRIEIPTANRDEAAALAATFPKACKFRDAMILTATGHGAGARAEINLASTGVTGEINEAGIRRLRTIRKALAAKAITVTADEAADI